MATPPAGLHRSSALPFFAGRRQVVPCRSLWLLSLIFFSSFYVPYLLLGPCQTQGLSCPRLPYFFCLPPSPAHLTPPPSSLDWWPIPLPAPKGLCCVLLSPGPCASASPFPFSAASLGIFWSLISLRVSFCARARGQGASTPCKSLAQSLSPMLLWHAVAVQDTPPLSLSLYLFLVLVIPPLLGEVCGA